MLAYVCFASVMHLSLQSYDCFAAQSSEIPVHNGSFETPLAPPWGTGQYAAGKSVWWTSGNAKATATIDEHIGKHGSRSLHIVNVSARAPHAYGTTQQPITIQPGKRYRISLWARGQNLASPGAVTIVVDDAWRIKPIALPAGSFDWTQLSGEFTLPTAAAQIRVLSDDRGEAWLDDIHVTPVADKAAAVGVDRSREVVASRILELSGALSGWPGTRNPTPHGTWFECPRFELTILEPGGEYRGLEAKCFGNSTVDRKSGTVVSFCCDMTTRETEGVRRLKVSDHSIRMDLYGTVRVDQRQGGSVVASTTYPSAWLTLDGAFNPKSGTAEGAYSLVVNTIDAHDPPERCSGTPAMEIPAVFDGVWKATVRQ